MIRLSDYHRLILKEAGAFALSEDHEQDLYNEGVLVFIRTKRLYLRSKKEHKFSTWLVRAMRQHFMRYNKKNKMEDLSENSIEMMPSHHAEWDPLKQMYFKERCQSVSDEAKYIMTIFLEAPQVTLSLIGTETIRMIKGKLIVFLRNKGWTFSKIWSNINEIKQAFTD